MKIEAIEKYKAPKRSKALPKDSHLRQLEGHPASICDGFMLDFQAEEKYIKRAVKTNELILEKSTEDIKKLLKKGAKNDLSEPKFIAIETANFDFFILENPKGESVGIQKLYYEYFKQKYPKCTFRQNGDAVDPIIVYDQSEIKGIVMPVALPTIVRNI
jgi:hypothetical protein